MDYHIWQRFALQVYVAALLLVFALIPFGSTANGAKRWIRFPVFGGVQPADVSKFAVIVLLAALVCGCGKKVRKLKNAAIIFMLTAGIQGTAVFIISNNMSSALIVFAIGFVMIFVAYPGYKIFAAIGAAAAAFFVGIYAWVSRMISTNHLTENFRLNRVLVWVDPERYISGKGYQTVQALYAIGSGGLFGKGLGKSLQKLGYIPESQNDMIFSIICEELGLFGAVCVILVFAVMLWRIAHIAQNAKDLFGTLLAAGVFAHIAIQVVLNIAVVTNLIPNTGVSLPFISYGGSSAVVLLAEVGIVMNVSSQIKIEV
jgi:cell division protein FtsW